ncbi:MAG: antitoxin MazE family protein [Promicromonosporaceae bacterium]|nr:antitoxin MazE family protein [Promicromonosporaceae bacterium]
MAIVTERVSNYRARLRAQGLRPVQLWLPDTHDPDFIIEARRQSLLAAEADLVDDTMDFYAGITGEVVWGEE